MTSTLRRFAAAPALAGGDILLPVKQTWWALFGIPLLAVMHWLVGALAAYPVTLAIGPFGLAVIAMTLMVRLVILPLTAYQIRASLRARRDAIALQERLAPAIAALRRRHHRRPGEFKRALAAPPHEPRPGPPGRQGRGPR